MHDSNRVRGAMDPWITIKLTEDPGSRIFGPPSAQVFPAVSFVIASGQLIALSLSGAKMSGWAWQLQNSLLLLRVHLVVRVEKQSDVEEGQKGQRQRGARVVDQNGAWRTRVCGCDRNRTFGFRLVGRYRDEKATRATKDPLARRWLSLDVNRSTPAARSYATKPTVALSAAW